jgi:hypothetical protein
MPTPSNPRAEAVARLDGRYDVRVLEPSPPAVAEPPWFADDPCACDGAREGRKLVSPVSTGDVLWEQLAADDPPLAEWCRERWLGPYRRLGPVPDGLPATRDSLHRLAEHVISPARQRANGKIGLRYTRGGFGTPFFGDDVQLRVTAVDGDPAPRLTVQAGAEVRSHAVGSIAAACDTLGADLAGPPPMTDEGTKLVVSPAAAWFLADWFGFAYSVLEQLRAEAAPALDPARVQIWPEHFDAGVELGSEADGRRAAYGCAPGDELHPEPYAYVATWAPAPPGELWQATAFSGAELPYAELVEAPDQRAAALTFFRERLAALGSS